MLMSVRMKGCVRQLTIANLVTFESIVTVKDLIDESNIENQIDRH